MSDIQSFFLRENDHKRNFPYWGSRYMYTTSFLCLQPEISRQAVKTFVLCRSTFGPPTNELSDELIENASGGKFAYFDLTSLQIANSIDGGQNFDSSWSLSKK